VVAAPEAGEEVFPVAAPLQVVPRAFLPEDVVATAAEGTVVSSPPEDG
jgi:hypothetical protein